MLLFAQILDNCTLLWRQGENVNVQNSCLEKLICCANLERRENSKRYQFSRYDITFSSARCVINFCPQIEHKKFLVPNNFVFEGLSELCIQIHFYL